MTDVPPLPRTVVLVVEDEPGLRHALALLLGLEDYEVVTACDGLQALQTLRSVRCDLVLTDRMMPRMDGLTLLRALRDDARLQHIPAILMSSMPRNAEIAPPLVDAFVAKPFEISTLLMTMRRLLTAPHG